MLNCTCRERTVNCDAGHLYPHLFRLVRRSNRNTHKVRGVLGLFRVSISKIFQLHECFPFNVLTSYCIYLGLPAPPTPSMAVGLGNSALLLDVTSPRVAIPDRKNRPVTADVVLGLFKKDACQNICISSTNSLDFEKESCSQRIGSRGKANSKAVALDFAGLSSDDEGNGNGNENGSEEKEGEEFDWEAEMRKRVKEIEDMKELEKKAEELQGRAGDREGEEKEETEEEKKRRR